MKLPPILLFLTLAARIAAVDVHLDDTLEQVIAAKGQPAGQMKTSSSHVLQYPDATIKFVNGRVTSITPAAPRRAPSSQPAAAPSTHPVIPEVGFMPAGFEAKLPAVVQWADAPTPEFGVVDYARRLESDGRQIIVFVDRNRNAETLEDFLAGWKRSVAKNRARITSETTRKIGQTDAVVIDAEFVAPGAKRHIRCLISVTKPFIYAITVTSHLQPVADDNVLTSFLNSIRIKPGTP